MAKSSRKLTNDIANAEASSTNEEPVSPTTTKPDNESDREGRVVAHFQREESFIYASPIPPPTLLRQYDEIDPGRAARLLNWVEDQSHHRMALEKQVITSDIRRSWGGLICGLIVCLAAIVGGCIVACYGHPAAGATIATASVVGLAGAFIYGTRSQRQERAEKSRMNPPKNPRE